MVVKKDTSDNKITALLDDLSLLENYSKELFSFFPLPICSVSAVGVVLEANPAFSDLTGYAVQEIIGEPIEKLFDKDQFSALTKALLKSGSLSGREMEISSKEGGKIAVSCSAQVRKDLQEDVLGYFLAIFNLADVKKTEKKLKETEAALLNMLEDTEGARLKAEAEKNKTLTVISNLADGLIVFDAGNKLSIINSQAQKILDVDPSLITGLTIEELAELSKLKPLTDLLGEQIKGIFRKELQINEGMMLEVSTVPIIDGQKQRGNIIILHDITREKMIERMKTEFVSLAAHQLRTPLAAIKWTLKMLLDGDLGQLTAEQVEFIGKTYQSNERMINLINSLLDVTRIEEGRYLYKPVFSDFESVVQFVINSYQDVIKRRKIKFEFKKASSKLPKVEIDVEKVRLAIQNLLDNALKYTPSGGKITITLKNNIKDVEFQIKDSGVGIPKDQIDRVFTKFFRGANVVRLDTEGSGLGVFIVKNVVEAHGGKIWFDSVEGQGTTFYFSLPVKKEFEDFLKEF